MAVSNWSAMESVWPDCFVLRREHRSARYTLPFLTEAYGSDNQMDADSRHFLEIDSSKTRERRRGRPLANYGVESGSRGSIVSISAERPLLNGHPTRKITATGGLLDHDPYRVARMPAQTDQSIRPDSYPVPGNDRAEESRHSDWELLPCCVDIAVRIVGAVQACHDRTRRALGGAWPEI